MKVLVTGAGGFVGAYVTEQLLTHNHDVAVMDRQNMVPLKTQSIKSYKADILDTDTVRKVMKDFRPDAVIHLAAISNVPLSWDNPVQTIEINICGSINVLEALHEANPQALFLDVGSSDEYGLTAKSGKPLTEDMECRPQNPYSISKCSAEQMVLQLGKKWGMKVIQTRSFNHFGPGQAKGFVTADFASQIAAIEAGKQEPVISVGDLSAYRDFTYVTDVVAAYVAAIENDIPSGVYNICSGKARQMQEILDTLLSLSGVGIEIKVDGTKFRPAEVPFFVGNCDKLKKATGWEPVYDFRRGMENVLNYWRERYRNPKDSV